MLVLYQGVYSLKPAAVRLNSMIVADSFYSEEASVNTWSLAVNSQREK